MRPRHLVVCALIVAATVLPAAGAAQAAGAQAGAASVSTVSVAKAKGKATKTKKPKAVKRAKKVPFTAIGTVTEVDAEARTVTLDVTGGMKQLRGKTITVTVAAGAKIVVDDARALLAAVEPGHRAVVVGDRAGEKLVAKKVNSTAPEEEESEEDSEETPETPDATDPGEPEVE